MRIGSPLKRRHHKLAGIVIANMFPRDTLSQISKEVCILCRITRKEADRVNRNRAARARAIRAVTEILPVKLGAASRISVAKLGAVSEMSAGNRAAVNKTLTAIATS